MRGNTPSIPKELETLGFIGSASLQAGAEKAAIAGSLQEVINTLQLPARYIGGERYSVQKNWNEARFRLALGFPDLYELGMSYLGLQILYAVVNSPERWSPTKSPAAGGPYLCERFFLPGADAREVMIRSGIELCTLESKHSLRSFDAVGISFTHERSFLNLPIILRLARIPVMQRDRPDDGPLVIGGGACMLNPEPIADMLDAVAVGEGEELVLDIAHCLAEMRGASRLRRLEELARIPGVFIPSFYTPSYEDGHFSGLNTSSELRHVMYAPKRIQRRILHDFAQWPAPTELVIPWVETPGNWANIEIMRGCPQRCRFCHAGHVYLPARVRGAGEVANSCMALTKATGADQLSLQGLSVLDHPQILDILQQLRMQLSKQMVNLSVPSLRMDSISQQVATLMRRPKESSLTFAPEAGSASLRSAINKHIVEDDIRETITRACEAGWHKFKLYFMCGFPRESEDDVTAIVSLTRELKRLARAHAPHPPHINVSINALIPKPHTPMQWAPLVHESSLRSKHKLLRDEFAQLGKSVHLSYTGYDEAFLETLLSRGDRRLACVIAQAHERGLWDSELKPTTAQTWIDACASAGIDALDEVHRERHEDEAFPWGHIDTGVSRKYLWDEWQKYFRKEASPSCADACAVCGLGCL